MPVLSALRAESQRFALRLTAGHSIPSEAGFAPSGSPKGKMSFPRHMSPERTFFIFACWLQGVFPRRMSSEKQSSFFAYALDEPWP